MTALPAAAPARSVLRERDLLIIAIANFASVAGDTAAIIALGLRLHAAGGGGWTIAALLLAGTVPLVVFSPVAGIWADRLDSRRAITAAALVQAACATVLVFADSLVIVLVLLALLSSAESLVRPATGALVPLVVGDERVAGANGVTQTAFVLGNLIGPGLGGALTGAFGSRAPLALDAVTFVLVAVGMSFVRTRRRPAPSTAAKLPAVSGWQVVRADSVLLPVVAALTALILMCGAVNVADIFLMKDALRTSDAIYGVISACWMGGMVVGSSAAARLGRDQRSLLVVLTTSVLIVAIGLSTAGAAPAWPVAAVAFVVGGVGNGGVTVASQTLFVQRTPEHVRGRVLGVVTASVNAALVLALFAGGALVAAVGPRATVVGCGLAAAAVGLAFAGLMRPGHARVPDTVPT